MSPASLCSSSSLPASRKWIKISTARCSIHLRRTLAMRTSCGTRSWGQRSSKTRMAVSKRAREFSSEFSLTRAHSRLVVPFDFIKTLQRFKPLKITADDIKKAAESSPRLKVSFNIRVVYPLAWHVWIKVSEDGKSVRRIKPYIHKKNMELDDWSIYVVSHRCKVCIPGWISLIVLASGVFRRG